MTDAVTGLPISTRDLEVSLAIALKMANFKATRGRPDAEEICQRAAQAIVADFARSGWRVVKTAPYPGFGEASQLPHFGGRRRCEDCD